MDNKDRRSELLSEEINDELSLPNLSHKKEEKVRRKQRRRRRSDLIKTRRSSCLLAHSQEWRRTNLLAQFAELENRRLNQR